MKYSVAVIVAALCLTAVKGSTLDAIIETQGVASDSFEAFQAWTQEFGKVYDTPAEFARRYANFRKNMEEAQRQNAEEPNAEYGYTRFSDLTVAEFEAGFLTFFPDSSQDSFDTSVLKEFVPSPPTNGDKKPIDWRPKINPIKDQKSCGSCWAFSAMAAAEGALAAAGTEGIDGSEQHLVDCDKIGSCRGGWMHQALALLARDGIVDQKKYPYKARDGKCKYDPDDVIAKLDSVTIMCANNPYVEPEIQSESCSDEDTRAALEDRELSIGINANAMMRYRSGIADPQNCPRTILNHGVDIVGFVPEDEATNEPAHYIIRNSWGTRWGEKGYYRLVSDKDACGIQSYQIYASV